MKDTTRMIIAFTVIMVVLFVWQYLTPKKPKPTTAQTTETTQVEPAQPSQATVPTQHSQISIPQKQLETETEAVLENKFIRVVLTNFGGAVKSIYLKKYQAELVPSQNLILQTVFTQDSALSAWNILHQDDSIVVFQQQYKKTYRLNKDYTLLLKIEGIKGSIPEYQISYEAGLAMTEANKKDEIKHIALFYRNSIKTSKVSAHKLKQTTAIDVKWIGLKSKYFTTILSSQSSSGNVNISPLTDGRIGYTYKPTTNDIINYTLYFGPLDYDILKSYKVGWEALNDLGWTKIFSIAILKFIKFLYWIFRNYGLAIIVFSIIMKAIFYPLTRMTNKQMVQMQMLQPKMEELKKKYKGDPQGLNRETMQLYRLYKVNPFSGCLPLVLQMPIFWALYSVLQKTIELRRGDFVFWLQDLSLKDPYYILPILMGVSFLIQNFLTSADKRNMALLIFMPIFLTVIFLNFPSGLQLYWLIFNLLSIGESMIARGGIKWKIQKTSVQMPKT